MPKPTSLFPSLVAVKTRLVSKAIERKRRLVLGQPNRIDPTSNRHRTKVVRNCLRSTAVSAAFCVPDTDNTFLGVRVLSAEISTGVVVSVCLTATFPFSGFLTLSTVCSPGRFAVLFHTASTLRIPGPSELCSGCPAVASRRCVVALLTLSPQRSSEPLRWFDG